MFGWKNLQYFFEKIWTKSSEHFSDKLKKVSPSQRNCSTVVTELFRIKNYPNNISVVLFEDFIIRNRFIFGCFGLKNMCLLVVFSLSFSLWYSELHLSPRFCITVYSNKQRWGFAIGFGSVFLFLPRYLLYIKDLHEQRYL